MITSSNKLYCGGESACYPHARNSRTDEYAQVSAHAGASRFPRRSEFSRVGALLALLLSASAAVAAPPNAPHDLAPPLDQEDSAKAAAGADAQEGVAVEPQETISESNVTSSPVDGFGTLEPGKGLSQDIWRGSTREGIDPFLKEIHSGIADKTLQELVTRLLMTQADPPQGSGSQGWFTLRVKALVAMGEDQQADQMMSSLPASMKDNSLIMLQTGLQLVRGEYDHACEKVSGDTPADDSGEDFWRKLSILCKAHAGKQDEAMVGIDLMREERHSDDVFFQEAIRRIGDRDALIRSNPQQWTLLNVALLRLSGDTEKLKGSMDSFPPVALKYLAQDSGLDPKLRERAYGRAIQLGVLPESEGNIPPEQPFERALASDVSTLVRSLGSGDAPNDADNAVIARLAIDNAGVGDIRRVQRLLTLMEPFGYRVPPDVWAKLFHHLERVDGEVPPASLVARLNDAAAGGRRGEVVLLAGVVAGGTPVDRVSDLALLPVVKALLAAGFEKEARAVAHDAVKYYSGR